MAINDIKIKSHDIYIEKENDKGGNLIIGNSTNSGDLTVNGNINVEKNIKSRNLIIGNSTNSGYLTVNGDISTYGGIINTHSGNIITSGALVTPKILGSNNTIAIDSSRVQIINTASTTKKTWLSIGDSNANSSDLTVYGSINVSSSSFSTNNEIVTNSLTVNASGISANSSVKDNDFNILKTNSLNMSSTGISLTTSGSTNVINISSPTMNLITDSMYIRSSTNTDNYIGVGYNTNTNRFTLYSMALNLNTYYGLFLNSNYDGGYIDIDFPAINIKTNRIDLESKTKDSSIDIDGFIKYTPTTNRSDSVSCDLTAFIVNNKFYLFKSGLNYRLKIVETLSSEEKAFFEPSKLYDIKFQFSIKDKKESKSEKNTIYLQQDNILISNDSLFLQMGAGSALYTHFLTLNNKLNEQYASTTGYVYRYEITYPIFQAKHKGKDATVSIDEHAHIQINDSNHLLLTSSSEGTTNISYFPNAVYNTDKNRLMVTAVDQVMLYPGDFIEYYPIGDENNYKYCYIHSNGEYGININETDGLPTNGLPGYIFYSATGITAGTVYVFHNNTITSKSAKDSNGNLLDHVSIDFYDDGNITIQDVGSAYAIIKR